MLSSVVQSTGLLWICKDVGGFIQGLALGVGFKDPGVRSKFLALEVANTDTTSILYMRLLSMKEWVTSSVL